MQKRLYGAVCSFSIFACASAGCGEDYKVKVTETREGSGAVGKVALPIFNGAAPDAPEHAAVVGLHNRAGREVVYIMPFCSGTLIAPDVVLTAAHCLDTAKEGASRFKTMSASKLAVYVGDDPLADISSHLYKVNKVKINPAYDRRAILNDIGLIRLRGPVTEPVDPVPALPAGKGFKKADKGKLINIAGFGETEAGMSGVKLQVDLHLGSLGCHVAGCFDAGDKATQIAYLQRDGGPCFGDSGGPAFIKRRGKVYVGGITSYGDDGCDIFGVSTRTDAFEGWISDFIAAQ